MEKLLKNATINIIELLESDMRSSIPISKQDRILVDAIPYAVCWKNNENIIIGCNKEFLSFVRLKISECMGKSMTDLFGVEAGQYLDKISERIKTENQSQEFKLETDDDQLYNAIESPIHKNNDVVGTILTISKKEDISESKKKKISKTISDLQQYLKSKKEQMD